MATQYTSILKLALPTQGELSGTWGDVVNDNITSMVEEAIAGRSVINSWAANSHTLTTADGLTSESRAAMLEFTDTGTALSGAATVICPTATKIYVCKNGAGQTVTVKTAAGTGVAIPNGETMFVFCDGTNVVQAVTSLTTLKVGTGIQVSTILDEDNMASDSATALATQQSIKAYVDAQITAQDLDFAGDTGTGAVDLDSQTFTVAGTANEIETSASGQTITIGLPTAIVVTTITTTNVQATNIKANDGTAAITIADSTGQVTVTDAVLTTADINGGTADNVTIGGSTAAAGSFTTLGASGTTTLSGALALTGNLDINTNKFNVTAVDGNTLIAGTLGVTGNVDLNGGAIDGTVIGNSTAAAVTGTTIVANTSIEIAGTTTVSSILDEDNMASDSDTALATQQSIKAYVDSQVVTVDTLAEILANGNTTGGNDILFADNDKAVFGAGSDLQIYHDGSDSYITHTTGGNFFINDDGAGYLMMKGSDLYFRNPSNVDMIHAQSGGFVKLYHNGVAKLSTTATGIDVTGTVTMDGLTVDGTSTLSATDSATNTVTAGLKVGHNTSGTTANGFGSALEFEAENSTYSTVITNATIESVVTDQVQISSDLNFYTKYNNSLQKRMSFNGGGDISFYEDTGTTAKLFWDASDETISIGSGTSSTATISAYSRTVSASLPSALRIIENTGASTYWDIGSDGGASPNLKFYVNANTTPKVTFTSSGNVGFGTSSPSTKGHFYSATSMDQLTVDGIGAIEAGINFANGGTTYGQIYFNNVSPYDMSVLQQYSTGSLIFGTNDTERMRIDSSGNVGIGVVPSTDHNPVVEALQIGSTANLFGRNDAEITTLTSNSYLSVAGYPKYITTNEASEYTQISGNHIWYNAPSGTAGATCTQTERMRIDSSGNLMVGTTSAFGTTGTTINAAGLVYSSADGDRSGQFDRTGVSDGEIVRFTKAGGTVGSIGTSASSIYIGGTSNGAIYFNGTTDVRPWNTSTQSNLDNTMDLGTSAARFKDIYATNGTIQTSDRNEKQDIEVLSEAEQRVAVACKGLLRKFRWKDAVEEKGDDARIHFGIIAQDLQAAFEAEGLDAGRYAMFISSTWTEEETGEERSRMGVRYSELLAFIIAAI
jgi:hypothetical protein